MYYLNNLACYSRLNTSSRLTVTSLDTNYGRTYGTFSTAFGTVSPMDQSLENKIHVKVGGKVSIPCV